MFDLESEGTLDVSPWIRLELEDAESKCNFNILVEAEDVDDSTLQGTTEADNTNAQLCSHLMFDLELEDAEFKCNCNKLVEAEDVDDGTLQGTTETDDAQNNVNMETGSRRGQEGELQRGIVHRLIDTEGNPIGVANSNQLLDTRQDE